MPSGSHGGGGGSHFGGGGSFGGHGGSSGSHFGGSYYHGPRTPGRAPIHFHYFYFGGSRYSIARDDRSQAMGMFLFAFFCLIMAAFAIFGISSSVSEVNKLEKDYVYYQNMITYAEEHPELIIEGKVYDMYYVEAVDLWYLEYTFDDNLGNPVGGYTFGTYTNSEIYHIHKNDTLMLAVDESPQTQNTNSIDMNFKNKSREEFGEMINAKNNVRTFIIMEIAAIGIGTLLVVLAIKSLKKNIEKVPEGAEPKKLKKYICTYCGSKLREEDTSCPKCGSSTIETIVEKEQK